MAYLIAIGSRPGDTILDPFMGSGTTGISAKILNRNFIGFEINGKYFELAEERIEAQPNQTVIESYTDDEPATKAME
jgi:DNA modification methylase